MNNMEFYISDEWQEYLKECVCRIADTYLEMVNLKVEMADFIGKYAYLQGVAYGLYREIAAFQRRYFKPANADEVKRIDKDMRKVLLDMIFAKIRSEIDD